MKSLIHYLYLTRLDVTLISFLSYLVGAKLAYSIALEDVIISLLVSLVSFNFIYSLNAWADWRIDKINKPARPIPSGLISPRAALIYSLVLLVVSIIYPFFIFRSLLTLILFLALPLIGLVYSVEPIRLRRFRLPSVIIVSLMLVIPIMLGYFMSAADYSLWPFFLILFTFCLSIIPLKDVEDVMGDERYGINNWAGQLGKKKLALYSTAGLTLNLLLIAWLPFGFQLALFLAAIVAGALIIIYGFIYFALPLTKIYKSIIWMVIAAGLLLFLSLKLAEPAGPANFPSFPVDEQAHLGVSQEWWYLSGHVQDQNNREYVFVNIITNNGDTKLALIDIQKKDYHVYSSHSKFNNNKISTASSSWGNLGNLRYRCENYLDGIEAIFTAQAHKPPLLLTPSGRIEFPSGNATYNYALTNVAIKGSIKTEKQVLVLAGQGWIDRQWGNWQIGTDLSGWEWFSVQLDDNSAIEVLKLTRPASPPIKLVSLINQANEITYIDGFNLQCLKSWQQDNDKFCEAWKITAQNEKFIIELNPSLDFTDQFLHQNFILASGKVMGTVNGEAISGNIIYEYYFP